MPSQPQTPGQSVKQPSGRGTHSPPAPHTGTAQYWSRAHSNDERQPGQAMGGQEPLAARHRPRPSQLGQQTSPSSQTVPPHPEPPSPEWLW